MKISVIIPTFNRASFLTRAIESVINQTYKIFELIIIDDGSSDDTFDVANRFCKEHSFIKYLKIENSGVSHARNTGVESCTGDWIAFLDSDDEWLPLKIAKQVRYIKENHGVRFVYTDESWYRDGKFLNKKKYQKKIGGDIFLLCLNDCFIGVSTVLLNKKLFIECGGFDRSLEVCEDFDLWLRITHKNKIGLMEEALVNKYAGHCDQLSTRYSTMDYFRILSLYEFLKHTSISQGEITRIEEVIKDKAIKLLPGLEKLALHGKYLEVLKILNSI